MTPEEYKKILIEGLIKPEEVLRILQNAGYGRDIPNADNVIVLDPPYLEEYGPDIYDKDFEPDEDDYTYHGDKDRWEWSEDFNGIDFRCPEEDCAGNLTFAGKVFGERRVRVKTANPYHRGFNTERILGDGFMCNRHGACDFRRVLFKDKWEAVA